jgi:hypothetical protein
MSKLFTPYNLSGMQLKNRVVMAPMTRTRTMNDVPDDVVALYYAQRASAGLLITEGMPVSEEGRGYLYTPGIYNAARSGLAQSDRCGTCEGRPYFCSVVACGPDVSYLNSAGQHRASFRRYRTSG